MMPVAISTWSFALYSKKSGWKFDNKGKNLLLVAERVVGRVGENEG